MDPISAVAERLGLDQEHLIPFGRYKAKISLDAIKPDAPRGKLVVVTGITPTPAGEGKTTTSIGLTDGLGRLGYKPVVNLREPALGPIFGIKGGGTGGGKARIVPEDEINIHFTGDAHAVGSTHNLLAALVENAVYRNNANDMAPEGVTWSRVTDASDRALRQITAGLGGSANSPLRETRFDFITASEIMAILALSADLTDLRERMSRMVVGTNRKGAPVSVGDLGFEGSLMAVMRHTIMPNLVQTLEGQPAIVHAGPFGNIAHGCSSIIADRLSMGYADHIITEAGFGSDLGFEKFMHIKTRQSGLPVSAAVLVSSVRAMRWHGGATRRNLGEPNLEAMKAGAVNMVHHINNVRAFGLPCVVALNRFPGGLGGRTAGGCRNRQGGGGIRDGGVRRVHRRRRGRHGVGRSGGAGDVGCGRGAGTHRLRIRAGRNHRGEDPGVGEARVRGGVGELVGGGTAQGAVLHGTGGGRTCRYAWRRRTCPCPHDPTLRGSPSGYTFPISDLRASVGAGFLYALAGRIETLPGLPTRPRAMDMDVTEEGEITGL